MSRGGSSGPCVMSIAPASSSPGGVHVPASAEASSPGQHGRLAPHVSDACGVSQLRSMPPSTYGTPSGHFGPGLNVFGTTSPPTSSIADVIGHGGNVAAPAPPPSGSLGSSVSPTSGPFTEESLSIGRAVARRNGRGS